MKHSVFFQKPQRMTHDEQAIELTDLSAIKPSPPLAASKHHDTDNDDYCCAIEMAILPIAAAHESVKESWRDAHTENSNFNEYLTVIIAAPFAYTPAILMAIIGFIYGLGIDCHYAIEALIENARSDREDINSSDDFTNYKLSN